MIIFLIFLVFVVLFLRDFKKGIIIYAPFKFAFSYGVPSYIGKFELDSIFTIALFVIWLLTIKGKTEKFPLTGAVVMAVIGVVANAFNPVFSITVLFDGLSPYLYLIMFFYVLKTENDLKLFVKTIGVYALILNINALTEWAGYNVLGTALQTVMIEGTYWANDVVARGIFVRLHSFVPHSIGYGVENMILFSFFLMLFLYDNKIIAKRKAVFLMGVTIIGIYLSGSRSPLLGGIIILLPLLLNKKMFNVKNMSFAAFSVCVVVVFAGGYISTMFDSLTSDADTDLGGASSWDMRLGQLEYSVYFWMQNFWFGNGHAFDIFQGGTQYSSIFGAESVWFPLMMRQGLVGMVSYLYITIDACRKAVKVNNKTICMCLMLGWLVIDTATNLPGLSILLPLYFYIVYYKWDNLLNQRI